MKKIFDRLRRWLIKKLGGYTERYTPIQPPIERMMELKPQKIQAQISVEAPGPDSAIDFKRYCESRVLNVLMQELYQSGFIMWESQNEIIGQRVNVRATLCVVNEYDLMPCVIRRVE